MQPVSQDAWYLARGGQNHGPYTWEQVVEHARAGRIKRSDKLFDPRSGVWARPAKVPGLLGPGGAASIPWGLAAYAMTAAVVLGLVAVLLGWFLSPKQSSPAEMGFEDGAIDIGHVTYTVPAANTPPSIPPTVTPSTAPPATIPGAASTATTPPAGLMGPEGIPFRGTARLEWKDRDSPGGSYWEDGPCFLWIYETEWGTVANFDFQEDIGYLTWSGRDMLPLVSHTGSRYVFQSSSNTRVDKWKIVVDVTDTGMSGTISNITPGTGTFIGGTFSGQAISYEQYLAEAPSN